MTTTPRTPPRSRRAADPPQAAVRPRRGPLASLRSVPGRPRRPKVRPSAPLAVRAAVWLVAIAAVVVGVGAFQSVSASQRAAFAASQAASQPTAGQPVATTDVAPPPASGPVAGLRAAPSQGAVCATVDGKDCTTPGGGDRSLLPAFRWRELGGLNTAPSGSADGLINTAVGSMAGLLITLANFVWLLLLTVVRIATTTNWLRDASVAVNRTFVSIAPGALLAMVVVWVAVLAKAGRLTLRGEVGKVFSSIIAFVVPAAMLLAMWGGASASVTAGEGVLRSDGNGTEAQTGWKNCVENPVDCEPTQLQEAGRQATAAGTSTMSPVGLAMLLQDKFDQVAGGFTGVMVTVTSAGTQSTSSLQASMLSSGTSQAAPNCAAYMSALFQRYQASLADKGKPSGGLGGVVGTVTGAAPDAATGLQRSSSNAVFTATSVAWVTGLYEPWAAAQFGDSPLKDRAACHYLEEANNVNFADRQITMGVAYPKLPRQSVNNDPNDPKFGTGAQSVYETDMASPAFTDTNTAEELKKSFMDQLGAGASASWECATSLFGDGDCGDYFRGVQQVATAPGRAVAEAGADKVADAATKAFVGDNTLFSGQDIAPNEKERKELQLRMMNWAACQLSNPEGGDGTWQLDPGFGVVGGDKSPAVATDGRTVAEYATGAAQDSRYCQARWMLGHGAPDFSPALGEVTPDTLTQDVAAAKPQVKQAYDGYFGAGIGNRLVYSMMALFGSIAYLLMIGAPSAGLLMASIGLIIAMAFLPLLLAFAATGKEKGQKGLRVIVGLTGSKALFTIMILLMVQLHLLVNLVVRSVNFNLGETGQAGFVNTVLVVASPVLVLFIANKITTSMGLGPLTSLKGATGMVTNAAMKATKAPSMGSYLNGGKRGGKGLVGSLKSGARKFGSAAKPFLPKALRNGEQRRAAREAGLTRNERQAEVNSLQNRKAWADKGHINPKTGQAYTWSPDDQRRLDEANRKLGRDNKRKDDADTALAAANRSDAERRRRTLAALGAGALGAGFGFATGGPLGALAAAATFGASGNKIVSAAAAIRDGRRAGAPVSTGGPSPELVAGGAEEVDQSDIDAAARDNCTKINGTSAPTHELRRRQMVRVETEYLRDGADEWDTKKIDAAAGSLAAFTGTSAKDWAVSSFGLAVPSLAIDSLPEAWKNHPLVVEMDAQPKIAGETPTQRVDRAIETLYERGEMYVGDSGVAFQSASQSSAAAAAAAIAAIAATPPWSPTGASGPPPATLPPGPAVPDPSAVAPAPVGTWSPHAGSPPPAAPPAAPPAGAPAAPAPTTGPVPADPALLAALSTVADKLDENSGNLERLGDAVTTNTDTVGALGDDVSSLSDEVGSLGDGLGDLGSAVEDNTANLGALGDQVTGVGDALSGAVGGFDAATEGLTEALDDHGKRLGDTADSVDDLRRDVRDTRSGPGS